MVTPSRIPDASASHSHTEDAMKVGFGIWNPSRTGGMARDHRTILVTGGAGFVGSHLATLLKRDRAETRVVAFDNLKRRGSELALSRLAGAGVEFAHGDVRAAADLAAGEVITEDHVRAIRPSGGLPPKERLSVIGRRAALALRRGTPLRPEHLA